MVKTILFSFFLSSIITPILIQMGKRYRFLDSPGGLKSHKEPVPFLGGVSLFIGIIASSFFNLKPHLILSTCVIFILGFVDDFKQLPPYPKLIVECIVAGFLTFSGIRTKLIFLPGWGNILLSIIWIVGITNAFNIIDVMDGIAGGVGFISSATFMLMALKTGNTSIALFSGALMGAVAGFLPYNLPRAKIFLGDNGSLLLGLTLSIISIEISYSTTNPVAVMVPLFVLFFPIFDTFYVIAIRLIKRINPLKGSPDHFVLKLKRQGLDIPVIDALVFLITISLCEASYIVIGVGIRGAIVVLILTTIIFSIFGVILHKR